MAVLPRQGKLVDRAGGFLVRRLGNHRKTPNWYVNAERTLEEDSGLAWLKQT